MQDRGICVVAAGNSYDDASNYSPASSDDVITVGNQNKDGGIFTGLLYGGNPNVGGSSYGDDVDIYAPGVNILSSLPNNLYGLKTGTSMSSPLVAGIIANILASDINLDFDGVKKELLGAAVYDLDDLQGRTNLPRALLSCQLYKQGMVIMVSLIYITI